MRFISGVVAWALALCAFSFPVRAGSPFRSPDLAAYLSSQARELASENEEIRWNAGLCLVESGEAAVPVLLKLIETENENIREAGAFVLMGMAEDGVLGGERPVIQGLANLIRGGGYAGEIAGDVLARLGETDGRRAVVPLIELLRDEEQVVRKKALGILVRFADSDLEPDPVTWKGWWSAERVKYMVRERPRVLPMPSQEDMVSAPGNSRAGGQRVRLVRADLHRQPVEPPVPRTGRWWMEGVFDVDAGQWAWGVFPARVWFIQQDKRWEGRLAFTRDFRGERNTLRALAVAPASIDPYERVEVVFQMVDARDESVFLLATGNAKISESH